MLRRPAAELVCALLAILGLTAWYWYTAQAGIPKPSSLTGHVLGTVGFLLMLATEVLYSARKRLERCHVGPAYRWLQAHVFTGLVGPYLVLLHSGWQFQGLAGVLLLLTGVMVVSGFVGRYLYTAVPRTLDGAEVAVQELEQRIEAANRKLQGLGSAAEGWEAVALATELPQAGWKLVLARPWVRWRQQRRFRQALGELTPRNRAQAAQLESLLDERLRLQMQIRSLVATRRLLALWYVFHLPLGVTLFSLAFIHVGAALYYATFLK